MKKQLKLWGESGIGIYFNKEEREIYNLEEGDIINIDDRELEVIREYKSGAEVEKYLQKLQNEVDTNHQELEKGDSQNMESESKENEFAND